MRLSGGEDQSVLEVGATVEYLALDLAEQLLQAAPFPLGGIR